MLADKYAIKKDNIGLRVITEDDTDNIIRWRNSREVMEHFIDRNPLTREIHLNWLKTKVKTGKVAQYIICVLEDNKETEIGSTYFRDIDNETRQGEFGIFISREYTGKGYGTKTLNLMKQIGFKEMHFKKITLRVLKDNAAAIKSYEKNGFIPTGEEETVCVGNEKKTVMFMECLSEE